MELGTLIQQALEASGKLRELAKTIENADFRMALAELHSALADAKLESVDLKMSLAESRQKVADLEAQLRQKQEGEPEYVDGLYVFPDKPGRFCTRCWDVDQIQVRVAENPPEFQFAGKWDCPSCKATYA